MKLYPDRLRKLTTAIFHQAGCLPPEAERIAAHLVEANLVGHDSHGVIRVPSYVHWLRTGKVFANRSIQVVFENEAIAVVDGQFGFGQTIGEQAVQLGIDKSSRHGVAVIALRNSGHLGRIGDWPLMAARAGKVSLHFVNTSGAGILVAPFGGINRRLSANPIAAGVPSAGGPPILLDMSACTIAEGKIRVARNKGVPVPENCIIDARGRPTTDPEVFYADPPGAILSIAGHKGYGLAVLCEVLAGALTGGGCSNPQNADRVVNGMLSIYLDASFFQSDAAFTAEINQFIDWVKSSEKAAPNGTILMPGEIEEQTKARRERDGIELDATTWSQLLETAQAVGLRPEQVPDILPGSGTSRHPEAPLTDQYATIAAEYKKSKLQPWRLHLEHFTLFELIGDLQGKSVLDLACGEGFYTRRLKQRGAARVVGVDLSPPMIELARAEEARQPLGIEYIVHNASTLDLKERFDLIVAAYLLNYSRTREELLAMYQAVARSLKPGCRFVTVNDNIAQPLTSYAATKKYGVVKSIAGELKEGTPVTISLDVEGKSIAFDNYFLSIETHEAALKAAGLRDPRWHLPRLSPEGEAEYGKDHWAEFLAHSPIIFLECTRA